MKYKMALLGQPLWPSTTCILKELTFYCTAPQSSSSITTFPQNRHFTSHGQPNDLVLITLGSGFVGSHCIVSVLNTGHRVRTTVRSLSRSEDVRAMLRVGGVSEDKIESVQFRAVDLTSDDGWTDACKDCTYEETRSSLKRVSDAGRLCRQDGAIGVCFSRLYRSS